MPNGFHGPKVQWEALEAPLQALDGELRAFAERHGIALSSNSRNWPDRSMSWGDSIRRLMQIYLVDEEGVKYSFWLCASEDRGNERYWRREFLKQAVPIGEIAAELPELLSLGRALLDGWTTDALEFATKLERVP